VGIHSRLPKAWVPFRIRLRRPPEIEKRYI